MRQAGELRRNQTFDDYVGKEIPEVWTLQFSEPVHSFLKYYLKLSINIKVLVS